MKPETENQSDPNPERSPEYEGTLQQIDALVDAPEEERQMFIQKRLTELGKDTTLGELSHVWSSIHRGFIGPEVAVRRNLIVDPFVVDDPDLYSTLFQVIKLFRENPSWRERPLRSIIPGAIQWALSTYFGNPYSTDSTEVRNREYYLDHTDVSSTAVHLSELKGQNLAVCAEKGAAGQNLLAFVGLESDLIASGECRIPADSNEDAHYFILLHAPSGEKIYDPTNPFLTIDHEGRIKSYGPAIYPLTPDQSRSLLDGEPVTVEHVDTHVEQDGSQTKQVTQRLYKIPKRS